MRGGRSASLSLFSASSFANMASAAKSRTTTVTDCFFHRGRGGALAVDMRQQRLEAREQQRVGILPLRAACAAAKEHGLIDAVAPAPVGLFLEEIDRERQRFAPARIEFGIAAAPAIGDLARVADGVARGADGMPVFERYEELRVALCSAFRLCGHLSLSAVFRG